MTMSSLAPAVARAAFRDHLAGHRSVTEALAAWCEARGLGAGPIRAERLAADPDGPVPAALAIAAGERLVRRRVRLVRGSAALADAENLYLPGRLPGAVARALDETDTPFFTLLAAHGFVRAPLAPPRDLPGGALETVALITLDGCPVSRVRERFAPALWR
jgi:hypothetical protein